MRVLLDQGLAPRAAKLLRNEGWDAVHVMELGMDRAEDPEILEFARNSDRICITLDHDFHSHLALSGGGRPSVVFLRAQGVSAEGQAHLIRAMVDKCRGALTAGAAVSADLVNIRIRPLPLRVTDIE